jgi:hypothetical protein
MECDSSSGKSDSSNSSSSKTDSSDSSSITSSRGRLQVDGMMDRLKLQLVGSEQALELQGHEPCQALGVMVEGDQPGKAEEEILEGADGPGWGGTPDLAAPTGAVQQAHRFIEDELVDALLGQDKPARQPGAVGRIVLEPETLVLVLQVRGDPVERAHGDPIQPDDRKEPPQPVADDPCELAQAILSPCPEWIIARPAAPKGNYMFVLHGQCWSRRGSAMVFASVGWGYPGGNGAILPARSTARSPRKSGVRKPRKTSEDEPGWAFA